MESEATVSPILASGALAIVFLGLIAVMAADAPAQAARTFALAHVQKAMFAVAAAATVASLYYSEVVGFLPCEFCWYQRIMMYPLAVVLGVTLVTRTRLPARYIVVLAVIGLGLSIYHYQLQLFPEQGEVCGEGASCAGRYVDEFGFVTIPFMAGCSFLTILLLQAAEWRAKRVAVRTT
jgi:disulfide bond formation protein DsbB